MSPERKDATAEEPRRRIAAGLSLCIVEKGYSQTKLIDVADACDTSTSLIRYYFRSKEAILEYQYQSLVQQFSTAVAKLDQVHPAAWLRAFADLIFDEHPRAQQSLLVLIEANLVMARSPKMLALKRRYDHQVLLEMEQRLDGVALPDGQSVTQVSSALFDLLNGLMINVALEPEAYRATASDRFCQVARVLTGLPAAGFATSAF